MFSQPRPNDVLLGRRGGTNHHPGNIKFREMLGANAWRYRLGDTHRVKQELVRQIIEEVHNQDPPGRFLKYDDYDDGAWRVVGYEEAREKIKQALRGYSDLHRRYLDKNHPVMGKQPRPNDVLFGRGRVTNHHPGNIMFRQMVQERKQQYRNETKSLFKGELAYQIVCWVRYEQDPPGRFLKKYDDGAWHDVGDKEALYKTSQALRENKEARNWVDYITGSNQDSDASTTDVSATTREEESLSVEEQKIDDTSISSIDDASSRMNMSILTFSSENMEGAESRQSTIDEHIFD